MADFMLCGELLEVADQLVEYPTPTSRRETDVAFQAREQSLRANSVARAAPNVTGEEPTASKLG